MLVHRGRDEGVVAAAEGGEAIAQQMGLPNFAVGVEEDRYEVIADLVEKYKLAEDVNVSELLEG